MPRSNARAWTRNACLAASIAVMLTAMPSLARGADPILCGETVEGEIAIPEEIDSYTFNAAGGEAVLIATPGSQNPEACWQLVSPSDAAVGLEKCGGHGTRTLPPEAGLYRIDVSANGLGATGPYALSLEFVSATANGVSNGPPSPTCARAEDGTRAAACGETLTGAFEVAGEIDSYTFDAVGGETVAIAVPGTKDPETCWQLFAPDGTGIGLTTCREAGTRTLPAQSGVYTLVAFDAGLDETGSYDVTIEALSGTANGVGNGPPSPTCLRGDDGTQVLSCGETKLGTFAAAGETDTFTFDAQASETVGIAVSGTSNPEACWQLYDPTGAAVGNFTCRGVASRALPAVTGTYTVLVFEDDWDETGSYAISLEALSGTANGISNGPPAPTCKRGVDGTQPLVCNQLRAAAFDVVGETDSFAFHSEGDHRVTISVPTTSNPESCWQLFAPDGGAIGGIVCRNAATRSLPAVAGTYTIHVFDTGNDETGAYTIGLSFLDVPCTAATPTLSPTPTPSATPTVTPTATPTLTATATHTPDPTPVRTPGCGNGLIEDGELCDQAAEPSGCLPDTLCTEDCSACVPCGASLALSSTAAAGTGETCVLVELTNTTPVRAIQGSLVDLPDELAGLSASCVERAAGFACTVNEVAASNTIELVVVDLSGECIAPGSGPVARVCMQDRAPLCTPDTVVSLELRDASVADCESAPLEPVCTKDGSVLCQSQLGDCLADGDFDLFDILFKIDIVLQRASPTDVQAVLCDDDCDGDIDIFDVVREIDALLQRIPLPLTCPGGDVSATDTPRMVTMRDAAREREETPATVRQRGRAVLLRNRSHPVRGLELTLAPVGGPVAVREIRGTRRVRGLDITYSQADPSSPVKVVVVSLDGSAIAPGRGPVLRVVPERTRGGGRLRMTEAKIVEEH